MKRHAAILLLVLFGLVAALPWGLYKIGLGNINPLPAAPENTRLIDAEATSLWNELKEVGAIKVEQLSPYGRITALLGFETYESRPGERLAWFVARSHNATHLNDNRSMYWHLSGAALTIWLTRNWSAEQLLAKAMEIRQRQESASYAEMHSPRTRRVIGV